MARLLKLVIEPARLRWRALHGRRTIGIGRGGPHDEAESYARLYARRIWPERPLEILVRAHPRCIDCAADVRTEPASS